MIIDTHQHFWRLDRKDYGWLTSDLTALYRDFLPSDLKPHLAKCGVDATIAVQAADTVAETEFLLSLADENPWICGVVGWVDLEASSASSDLDRLAKNPRFLGVRPMLQDLEDDIWMLRTSIKPALAKLADLNLTFDALVMPRHLSALKQFLAENPDLRVVVDHGAKPIIREGLFEPWASDMAEIATFPNVYCKVSGLVTEANPDWTADHIDPYMDHLVEIFGLDRLMFGSDWPVLNLASDYGSWMEYVVHKLGGQEALEQLSTTAQRAYPNVVLPAVSG